MTRGEWDDGPFYMHWSIPNEEDAAAENALEDDLCPRDRAGEISKAELSRRLREVYFNVRLDLSAPEGCPDGVHVVRHGRADSFGEGKGAKVVAGQFDPRSTDDAVLDAVCRSYGCLAGDVRKGTDGTDHVFIEGWRWDGEQQVLWVSTGS